MTSGRENYEHNQLIYRRREAYDQHHMLEQELKSLRAELHTLDDKLKQSHPNEIADVLHHMGRIGFIQSELDGTSLDKEAEAFANNELGIRFDTLFEKLRAMAKVGGMDWKLREEKTQRLYSVQQSLIKKQDEIINLDHAYFSSIEYNEQYATTPPPPVDDDVFEKWIEQSQLTEKEIHDYDREAWADEKQWMEISAEAQERALEELRQQNVDAEAFEERMKAAMRLETEIEGIRQKLQSSVRRLQNVQQARKKTIQQRIDLQDAVKMKEAEYNSQIAELEDFFDMIVPTGIWPDYIVGKPSEAYDPAAAQAFQDSLQDTMDFQELQEFHTKQQKLAMLRAGQREWNRGAAQDATRLEEELDKDSSVEDELRAEVIQLRDELNMKNGMRAAELQVALPRIKVVGEDELEIDPPKFARSRTGKSSTTDAGDRLMHWTAIDQSATVKVEGVSAEGKTGEVKEASASIVVGTQAAARAEVYQKKQDNDDANADVLKTAEDALHRGDVIAKRLEQMMSKQAKVPFQSGLRQKEGNGKSPNFNVAVDALNIQHEQGQLVGKVLPFKIKKNKHSRFMLAYRCGIDVGDSNTVEVEILARGEPTGNTVACYFPSSGTTGDVAIYPTRTGDWEIYTGLHYDDEWVELSLTTPGVLPMAKIDTSLSIDVYLGYYAKLQAAYDARYAIQREIGTKKKANG